MHSFCFRPATWQLDNRLLWTLNGHESCCPMSTIWSMLKFSAMASVGKRILAERDMVWGAADQHAFHNHLICSFL
ncbi:hypothetical protein REMIM1_PC00091 (plasmid) [Rhizobium etli bv. mimosae str. Mim1]|nr:hypothetical protein REMIM1_PC00091 [Rhizobium etli bv. mimosae str. Mim1]